MIFSFSFDDASTQETEKKAAVLPTTLRHHLHTWNLQTCSKYVHFKKLFKPKTNKKKEIIITLTNLLYLRNRHSHICERDEESLKLGSTIKFKHYK